ncbi:restriction modification system DNA specificity subunit [Streptomyces bingchenggensis BCW-1]|uniref:Restriction modification system DNA specificity subunit n=1 Tax=Streptomyces bingchenggensis (strain BCW-1) TaxID=749414 RepID=D7CG17_STRBB|nr:MULTISPECIES: restriction endonuclease subunit S [Streptomyces]ADI06925.1 restriction modification system DNA specificity subunit [Streptomyces bingchenggensis BCW-1]
MSWATIPLKFLATSAQTGPFGSQLHSDQYITDGIPVINPSNIKDGKLVPDRNSTVSVETAARLAVHRLLSGDIIFARRGELGRSAIVTKSAEGWLCGTGSIRVRINQNRLDYRFAGYALQNLQTYSYFQKQSVGSTMENLNTEIVLGLPVALPTLANQRRIADFLDSETEKIDAFTHKTRRLLHLLDEKIASRILGHVGASQLNDIHSGSPVREINKLLTKVVRPPIADGEVITAYRDGQVTARSLRRAEGYTVSATTEAQGQRVDRGDIVIHGLDGFAGAIGTSEAAGNCSPVYHVCIPRNGGDSLFYGRLLRILALSEYLGPFATSTRERAVDFRNWNLFGRIPIPDVSFKEQQEIGEWIKSARPLRIAVDRSNALAIERRQALITAAVTGQIDVSTASGRGIEE